MAVVSNPVNGRLRITTPGPMSETIKSIHRIRPSINSGEAIALMAAVDMLSQKSVGGAFLTVTTELKEDV